MRKAVMVVAATRKIMSCVSIRRCYFRKSDVLLFKKSKILTQRDNTVKAFAVKLILIY